MVTYIVYGADYCPWCVKAYKLLKSKNISFIKRDPREIGATMIPQIYRKVGGYSELENMFKRIDLRAVKKPSNRKSVKKPSTRKSVKKPSTRKSVKKTVKKK